MFMDQAGWHRCRELVIPEGIGLGWLPPYSPECNPAEHVLEEIREKWFGNTVFQSMGEVEATLSGAPAALEDSPTLIQSLTGFDGVFVGL